VKEKYEITYLCEEGKTVDVKKTLEENQVKIEKETDLGLRGLAYPIGKVTKARYLAIRFELEPSELINIDNALRLNKEIVRYLIVKNPPEAPIKTVKAPENKVEAPKPLPAAVPPTEKVEVEKKIEEPETKKAAAEPTKEVRKTQEKLEVKTEEPQPLAGKTEVIEEKPAKKIKKVEKKLPSKEKPVKISQEKLDEKLKELTLE
jgi:ribosomal protein S6